MCRSILIDIRMTLRLRHLLSARNALIDMSLAPRVSKELATLRIAFAGDSEEHRCTALRARRTPLHSMERSEVRCLFRTGLIGGFGPPDEDCACTPMTSYLLQGRS